MTLFLRLFSSTLVLVITLTVSSFAQTTCSNLTGVFNSSLTYGTVTDVEGNEYKTIQIGTQTWMAENLRTTKYNNGTSIQNTFSNQGAWRQLTTGAYCSYQSNTANDCPYGKLYNWHAVNDPNKLCPTDWHVPTDDEWSTLTTFLGGTSVAGSSMKSTSIQFWPTQNSDATNNSGLSLLPAGWVSGVIGPWNHLGIDTYLWSSTKQSQSPFYSWFRSVGRSNSSIGRAANPAHEGYSVRCLKDPDSDNDGTVDASDCAPSDATKWRNGNFYLDADGDGYGTGSVVTICYGSSTPAGYATQAGDCNDNNAAIKPGATEICNGIDDNCNGLIDDGVSLPTSPSALAAQGRCGVTNQNFTFFNVTAGSPGDQIEWATNESFTSSTIVSSPATINVNNVAPGTISPIYIRSRISSSGCVSNFVSTSATVTLENTWLGGTGNWTDPTKWSCGNVPSSAQNVIINNGIPTLNTNFTSSGNITLSGTGGLIIAPRQILTISGTTNFGGRPVTISSDTTGSGAIGQINGTLNGATNVTVERFIPASRSWRSLTAPLTGSSNNSVFYNWQNNGVVNGAGAIIWNKTGGPGLATGGTAASMLRYDSENNTWLEVTNTQTEPLFTNAQNNSFLIFISGPYNTLGTYITKDEASTTLRATGTLRQGTIDFSLSGPDRKRLAMVGNPYASSVLFETVSNNSTGIEERYWVWDPGPKNSKGAYKLFEKNIGWIGGGRGDFDNSGIIPSGQAIFVRFRGSGLVRFTEASKSTNVSNTGFRLSAADPRININLNQIVNNKAELRDAVAELFVTDANAGVDDRDAVKLSNAADNLSLLRNGSNLTLERRPTITSTDTMYLRMWGMSESKYQLAINPEYFGTQPGVTAVLQDAFLGTESVLPLTEPTNVSFDVTSNTASSGNRFRIVLRSSAVTSVNDLNSANKFAVYPNPVAGGGALQFEFRNATAGKYTIALFNMLGIQVVQQVVNMNGGSSVQGLSLPAGLSAGTYIAECTDADGKREKVKVSVY